MNPKRIAVETDGDRYPRDVYLIDQDGNRVATIEGHNETAMRHFAEALARAYNTRLVPTAAPIGVRPATTLSRLPDSCASIDFESTGLRLISTTVTHKPVALEAGGPM